MWLIATYDRWVEELVAAGRLPGDIAEEIEWRANTGGCVSVKTHIAWRLVILHMNRGVRHSASPSTFLFPVCQLYSVLGPQSSIAPFTMPQTFHLSQLKTVASRQCTPNLAFVVQVE